MRLIKGKTFYNKGWFSSYRGMMDRCYRETANNYPQYGGRGIRVCDEWHNIENFEKWAEKTGYTDGLTIERINVNGDYSPLNCKWATRKDQANNRRNSLRVCYNGESHTLSEWAELLGVNRSTLRSRYYRGDRGDRLFEERRYL